MNKVIAIAREFGSGGRELGIRLAKELDFDYYDHEIISEIVKDTSLSEEYVKGIVEARPQRMFPVKIGVSFSMENDYAIKQMQDVYAAQTQVIKEMAKRSDCVIVGRCADYILENCDDIQLFKIFVYADMDSKVRRCFERADKNEQLSDKDMRKQIQKIDKARASYYSNYTLRKWGDKQYFDFCVNTSDVDIEAMAPHFAKLFTLPPKPEK